MHKGRLTRIILLILIVGMSVFIFIKNNSLQKQLDAGEIEEITVRDFLPFGGSNNDGIVNQIIDALVPGGQNNQNAQNLNKTNLIAEKVAGFTIVNRPDEIAGPTMKDANGNDVFESIVAIRYVLRENGYVYDYIPKYKKSYLISNTDIPKVYFAHFSPDGNSILFQYLDADMSTEKSILGRLGEDQVFILPDNVISFAFSKNGDFAYFKPVTSGSLLISINPSGKETVLYDSPLTEWNVEYTGDELLITTKASELANGFSYIINPETKIVSKLWTNEIGLTTKASLNGGYILKSISSKSGPEMHIYNKETKDIRKLDKLGLTEKCNFSNDETILICGLPKSFENKYYPDSWYSGEVVTDDTIVKYTTENLNERILPNIKDKITGSLNIWKISQNDAGNITAFTNRQDMNLWIYEE